MFIQEVSGELESALLEEIKIKKVSLLGGLLLEKICRQARQFV